MGMQYDRFRPITVTERKAWNACGWEAATELGVNQQIAERTRATGGNSRSRCQCR